MNRNSTKTTVKRAVAFAIDWNLIFIISMAVLVSGKNFNMQYLITPSTEMFSSGNVILGILCFILLPLTRDLLFRNASIGKMIMGLRVVDPVSGNPPDVINLIKRNVTFYIFPIEAITFFANNGKKIGDDLSGTAVVEKKPKRKSN